MVNFNQVAENPGFKYLWANQILLQLAYNSVNFSLLVWVFYLTDSTLSAAALILTIIIPTILFGIFAGVLVDISDRRRIILTTDILLTVIFLAFALAKDTFWVLLGLSFVLNAIYQFFIPAEGSSIPMLVPKNQLLLANSLFNLTMFSAVLVGYSLAGPIMNFFSIHAIFIMAALLSLSGMLISQRLPRIMSHHSKDGERLADSLTKRNLKTALSIAIKQVRQTTIFIKGKLPVAVSIGVMAGTQGVIGSLGVLTPAYMEKVVHISATDASYIFMFPLGLGMVLGAILIGRFGMNIPRRVLVTRGILVAGLVLFLIAIAPALGRAYHTLDLGGRILRSRPFFLAPSLSTFTAIFAFILGMATVSVIAPTQTVLQEYTPEGIRGKIFAVLGVMTSTFAAVPVILVGILAQVFGVLPIVAALGLIVLVMGLLGSKPAIFFAEHHLSYTTRQFLGLGHWEKQLKQFNR